MISAVKEIPNYNIEILDDIEKANSRYSVIKYIEYRKDDKDILNYLKSIDSVVNIKRVYKESVAEDSNNIIKNTFLNECSSFLFGAIIVDLNSIISYKKTKIYVATYDMLLKLKELNKIKFVMDLNCYIELRIGSGFNPSKIKVEVECKSRLNKEEKEELLNELDDYERVSDILDLKHKGQLGSTLVIYGRGAGIDQLNKILTKYNDESIDITNTEDNDVTIDLVKLPGTFCRLHIRKIIELNGTKQALFKTDDLELNNDGIIIGNRLMTSEINKLNIVYNVSTLGLLICINVFGNLGFRLLYNPAKSDIDIGDEIGVNEEVKKHLEQEKALLESTGSLVELHILNDLVINVASKEYIKQFSLPKAPVILCVDMLKVDNLKVNKVTKSINLTETIDSRAVRTNVSKLTIGSEYMNCLRLSIPSNKLKIKELKIREGVKRVVLRKNTGLSFSRNADKTSILVSVPDSVESYNINGEFELEGKDF